VNTFRGTGTRGRLSWLLAGLVATVTAIAVASATVWYAIAFKQHMHGLNGTDSYAGNPALVTIQLSDGSITISSGPPGRVTVSRELEWNGARPVASEHWYGRTFSLRQECASGFDDSCTASYTITVPPGVPVNVQTDSGDITADGTRSPELEASSDSGDITLSFGSAPYTVWASSDSGNVSVSVPAGTGYAVHPRTANGNSAVLFSPDPSSRRSITAISDDGNITVGYN
jgi:hypothetical protein